jgi:hypothetical protein
MGFSRFSSRRIPGGDALAHAFLRADGALSFDELMAAAPGSSAGDVAAWLGHAIEEGLLFRTEAGPGAPVRFSLRARGRRLLAAGRRATEREAS